jgi:tRNA threonylcarbamoyladenosine biosynthesis protein TsaE
MMFYASIDNLALLATQFWDYVGKARVFAFHGEMGAGKTTIIESLCKAKGVRGTMGSPTYSIINEYGYTESGEEKIIYHIDLYRLKDEAEVIQAGVEDCMYSNGICFVEWPEKAPYLFDQGAVSIFIEVVNNRERRLKIALPSNSMKEQS